MEKRERSGPHQRRKVLEKLPLSEPIHAWGEEIRELEFHRVTVADLHVIDENEGKVAQSVEMLARITDTTPEAIDELGLEDFEKAVEVMERFFGRFGRRLRRSASKRKGPPTVEI